MYCINCGAENSDDAVFCDTCGSNIREVKAKPQQGSQKITQPSTPTPLSNSQKIGIIVPVIIIFVSLIIAF
jgi:uncharacterized membrane protein YvbJ